MKRKRVTTKNRYPWTSNENAFECSLPKKPLPPERKRWNKNEHKNKNKNRSKQNIRLKKKIRRNFALDSRWPKGWGRSSALMLLTPPELCENSMKSDTRSRIGVWATFVSRALVHPTLTQHYCFFIHINRAISYNTYPQYFYT